MSPHNTDQVIDCTELRIPIMWKRLPNEELTRVGTICRSLTCSARMISLVNRCWPERMTRCCWQYANYELASRTPTCNRPKLSRKGCKVHRLLELGIAFFFLSDSNSSWKVWDCVIASHSVSAVFNSAAEKDSEERVFPQSCVWLLHQPEPTQRKQ